MPPPSCQLTDTQRAVARANITTAVRALSDDKSTFDLEKAFTPEGHLSPVRGQIRGHSKGCWAYLSPVSLDASDILDGDGALILDPDTLAVVGDPVWFAR